MSPGPSPIGNRQSPIDDALGGLLVSAPEGGVAGSSARPTACPLSSIRNVSQVVTGAPFWPMRRLNDNLVSIPLGLGFHVASRTQGEFLLDAVQLVGGLVTAPSRPWRVRVIDSAVCLIVIGPWPRPRPPPPEPAGGAGAVAAAASVAA